MYTGLLQMLPPEIVKRNEPMREYTTFKIGGLADIMILPQNSRQVAAVAGWCRKNQIPLFIFGLGSNLLVREKGIRGVVMKIGEGLQQVKVEGQEIYAEAGISMSALAALAADHSLSGLEFAEGIPGSLGGAVVMNAGAYGGEMKNIIMEVIVVDAEGDLRTYNHQEMQFDYRHTVLQGSSSIVIAAHLKLQAGDLYEIKTRMEDYRQQRQQKQPLEMPSAGSTFRRPPGLYVGPMLEQLGLKGFSIGGAQVSDKHAGFIVNQGYATADDVLQLIAHIQEKVQKKYGVGLHTEVLVVGEE